MYGWCFHFKRWSLPHLIQLSSMEKNFRGGNKLCSHTGFRQRPVMFSYFSKETVSPVQSTCLWRVEFFFFILSDFTTEHHGLFISWPRVGHDNQIQHICPVTQWDIVVQRWKSEYFLLLLIPDHSPSHFSCHTTQSAILKFLSASRSFPPQPRPPPCPSFSFFYPSLSTSLLFLFRGAIFQCLCVW